MNEINNFFDPKDIIKIKTELKKEDAGLPCNIWGYIKDLENRIQNLNARIIKLEQK